MHIAERIYEFNKGRIEDLLPLKYKAMSENMFSFFRGTCHIFYEDLVAAGFELDAPLTWTCGDLHLENFGSYRGDNRLVYFDLNDFDEAALLPASWELVRIVTSIFTAFESLKIEKKRATNLAKLFLKSYCECLKKGKAFYIEPQTAKGIIAEFLGTVEARKKKALIGKKTERAKGGGLAISKAHPKHRTLDKRLKKELREHISHWIKYDNESPYNYRIKDIAFRLAGTSSLGLKRYIFLLQNTRLPADHMLLEMKEAAPSCVKKFTKVPQPEWDSEAARIVAIQQRMQNISPALASATTFKGESFIIQEMQPVSDSINFKLLKKRYRAMCEVINDMAMLTASSHLRSSGRQGAAIADDLLSFGADASWIGTIISYASTYVSQVRKDYTDFKKANEAKS